MERLTLVEPEQIKPSLIKKSLHHLHIFYFKLWNKWAHVCTFWKLSRRPA